MLSEKAITEFQQIYLEENGVELKNEEAEQKAVEFLNFFKIISKPIFKGDGHEVRKKEQPLQRKQKA